MLKPASKQYAINPLSTATVKRWFPPESGSRFWQYDERDRQWMLSCGLGVILPVPVYDILNENGQSLGYLNQSPMHCYDSLSGIQYVIKREKPKYVPAGYGPVMKSDEQIIHLFARKYVICGVAYIAWQIDAREYPLLCESGLYVNTDHVTINELRFAIRK